MTIQRNGQPLVALVDDNTHSARLLTRTMGLFGAQRVKWFGNAERGLRLLVDKFAGDAVDTPDLVIVDLKSSSEATVEFVRALRAIVGQADLPIAALAPSLEREVRDTLLEAGATAVFLRDAYLEGFQEEVAGIVNLLNRHVEDQREQVVANSLPADDVDEATDPGQKDTAPANDVEPIGEEEAMPGFDLRMTGTC